MTPCVQCGYMMVLFDTVCPRCKHVPGQPVTPAQPSVARPLNPIHPMTAPPQSARRPGRSAVHSFVAGMATALGIGCALPLVGCIGIVMVFFVVGVIGSSHPSTEPRPQASEPKPIVASPSASRQPAPAPVVPPKDDSSITYLPAGTHTGVGVPAPAPNDASSITYGPYSERIVFDTPTRYGESGARSHPALRAPLTVEYVMCKLQEDGGYLWSFTDLNYAGREWRGTVHLALLSETAEVYSLDVEVYQRNPISEEAYAAGGILTQFETRTAPSNMGGNIVGYRYTVRPGEQQPTTGYLNPAALPSPYNP